MFLSDMSEEELGAQAEANELPKWDSLCLLRWLGAETLRAALITPIQAACSPSMIHDTLVAFAASIGENRLMIRTDMRREIGDYVRGGNTFDVPDAIAFANDVLADKRSVIALEPTNRFRNWATVNIGVDLDGTWRCEILGPGYDASDLQRHGTPPEYVCGGLAFEPAEHISMGRLALSIRPQNDVTMEDRIASRIDNIVHHIFPPMGVIPSAPVDDFCRKWLTVRGEVALFREHICAFPSSAFRRALDTAQMLHHYRTSRRARGSFVLSSGVLERGRQVFWDVVDSETKWAT